MSSDGQKRYADSVESCEDQRILFETLGCIFDSGQRVATKAELLVAWLRPTPEMGERELDYGVLAMTVREMLREVEAATAHVREMDGIVTPRNEKWARKLFESAEHALAVMNDATLFWRDQVTNAWMKQMGLADQTAADGEFATASRLLPSDPLG